MPDRVDWRKIAWWGHTGKIVDHMSAPGARAKGNYERSNIAGYAMIATLNPGCDAATPIATIAA